MRNEPTHNNTLRCHAEDEALLDIPEEQWSVFDSDGFVLYTGTLDDCLYVQDHSHGGLTVMPVTK